jgi:hypothetical protein
MPGMTANITVLVQKVDSVLVVPGKALRFTPDASYLAEYNRNNPGADKPGDSGSQPYRNGLNRSAAGPGQSNSGDFISGPVPVRRPVAVWIKTGDKIHREHVIRSPGRGCGNTLDESARQTGCAGNNNKSFYATTWQAGQIKGYRYNFL